MKDKLWKIFTLVLVMNVIIFLPVYADTKKVTSVYVTMQEGKSDPGTIYPVEVTANSYNYEIVDVDVSKDYTSWKPGRKVTYSVTIVPKDGYSFSKKDTKVYASNGTVASNATIKSSKIEVGVNYIPKVTLEAPKNIYFEDEYLAKWDEVEFASAYEARIYQDGHIYKTVKLQDEEIDLSEYATDYEDVTFDVRAVAKDSDDSKYLRNSEWTRCDDVVSSSDNTSYGKFYGTYENYRFRDAGGYDASRWQYINGSWYFFNPNNENRAIRNSWAFINGQWYFFNEYCIMQTGWVFVNGEWYYLEPSGAMATGWICAGPSGPWYYLDMDSGAMWHDATTPDGYYVNSDGSWWQ